MEQVSTPSPMSIDVPSKTRSNSKCCTLPWFLIILFRDLQNQSSWVKTQKLGLWISMFQELAFFPSDYKGKEQHLRGTGIPLLALYLEEALPHLLSTSG